MAIRRAAGSSPLTRGKLGHGRGANGHQRLIPAHAGKTASCEAWCCPPGAHPRSRGENTAYMRDGHPEMGSSPLTRGKLTQLDLQIEQIGLIPAHAGKTDRCPLARRVRPAHPRSRGENLVIWRMSTRECGSSPLTRGKLARALHLEADRGLIPAHAGKTRRICGTATPKWAHPRSRGENIVWVSGAILFSGSSPLTRGKPSWRV